jgi:superfamily II DNA or RNA helicase
VNILVLEGLFNTHNKVISSKELMDRGELANLSIDIIMLNYDDITKKLAKDFEYQDEINFLISHRKRNSFISGLVQSLKGNTLVLFNRVDGHGKLLFDLLKNKMENVYFLHGKVDVKDRHGTIQKVDNLENSVIIASYGVFQLGINIPNLNNAIFASPSKSKIRNLQSIGRILRISSKKNSAKLYDIADNLVYKGKNNFTLNHLFERVKIYNDEEFKYRTHQYTIG